jgi:isopentenyl-diphosphate delta-isomerase
MGTNEVVLVNEKDEILGTMEKLRAHEEGVLHRAFSVIIFNSKGEMLIHKRASDKYHCGGLWTNACCSHPRLNESPLEGAKRRLEEEMGFTTTLSQNGSFIYKVDLENGLIEHEYDHLFIGHYDQNPSPNTSEVEDWKYISVNELLASIKEHPKAYTFWFKEIVKNRLNEIINYDKSWKKNNL